MVLQRDGIELKTEDAQGRTILGCQATPKIQHRSPRKILKSNSRRIPLPDNLKGELDCTVATLRTEGQAITSTSKHHQIPRPRQIPPLASEWGPGNPIETATGRLTISQDIEEVRTPQAPPDIPCVLI